MLASNKINLLFYLILVEICARTLTCQSQDNQEINCLKTKLNLLADRLEQLAYKESKNLEKLVNFSAQATKIVKQSQQNLENTKVQQVKLEAFESQLNKTLQFINNCCSQEIDTTTNPQNYDWNVKRNLTGHTSPVDSLEISFEGFLISGSSDKSIKVWNIETGECLKTLTGHSGSVFSLAISDEDLLISGSSDKTIKIWDIKTGQCLETLTGHTDWVRSLAISKEGKLISGADDRSIIIWDIESGKIFQTLNGHKNRVYSLAISKEGRLISGSKDRSILVWE